MQIKAELMNNEFTTVILDVPDQGYDREDEYRFDSVPLIKLKELLFAMPSTWCVEINYVRYSLIPDKKEETEGTE